MRIKHVHGAASLFHDGALYEPEESGYFRVPFELAQTLIAQPHWEPEPAEEVRPEPEPERELTPAEKAARTRALNLAKARTEAQ